MLSNNIIHEFVPAGRAMDKIPTGNKKERGFSLVELVVSMLITLVILGIAVATFSSALSSRARESSRTDAITSAQAALNIMSREIGNSGYGLTTNGIVLETASDGNPESYNKRLHFRTNTNNNDNVTSGPGEDVTFYYDTESQSVVRHDANLPLTSGVINRVSDVDFVYWNYAANGTSSAGAAAANTGRITIILKVILADVHGQPSGQEVKVSSDVTLRNSPYMLGQY